MIPIAGSAYTYAYATMGEFVAWIIGWDLILEYSFAASTVAVGWSGYFVSLLDQIGIVIPPQFRVGPGTTLLQLASGEWVASTPQLLAELGRQGIEVASLPTVAGLLNLPAVLIIAVITTILVIGIKESANVNNVIVIVKVSVVLLFIAIGVSYVNPANWRPFIPENTGTFGQFGWSGILRGAGVIFFAYIGFDAVSTAAQEAKNPQKDMPIGILGSLAVCTVLYIAVALVMNGIVPYYELNVPDPIAVAVDRIGIAWLQAGGEARRDFRLVLGDPGDAPRPAPDLLHHGQGRLASPVRGEDPPAFPDSSHHHHRHRHLRGAPGGAPPDPDSRRAGLHRNASRVRHRVRRCLGASKDASRDSAAVQDTSRTLGSPRRECWRASIS